MSGVEEFSDTLFCPNHASGFIIDTDGKGNTLIRVTQPWQGSAVEEQRLAIFESEEAAKGYAGEYIVGAADRVVCMSTSHVAMLDAIGRADAVVGVSGKQYIMNEQVANNPAVKDVGYDSNLNYELLVMLNPDVVLMYGVTAENSAVTSKLRNLGIPYLYLGDYTEESPLGKAEWLVAVAEIVGCRERGVEHFEAVAARYEAVKSGVKCGESRPKVMFNLPYQDVWYMPTDDSYMVQLVEDAGGEYIYKGENTSRGSTAVSLEEAYMLVSKSDIWLNAGQCSSLDDLRSAAPHFVDTRVVQSGEVYNNNRRRTAVGGSDFWESAIVRPDVVLADLAAIISGAEGKLYYYQKLQ
jgi:iron complex transport system substrate-binding protein